MTKAIAAHPGRTLDVAAISERYFDAWRAHDALGIAALHAEEGTFQLHDGGEPSIGRVAIEATFAGIFAMFPDLTWDTHDVRIGDRHWMLDWTLRSGTDVRLRMLDLVVVDDDGLVARKDTFADTAQYAALSAAGEDHADFVARFAAGWRARDAEALGALFYPDAVVQQPPVSRTFRGDEVANYIGQIVATFPDIELEVVTWAGHADRVLIEWSATATAPDGDPATWGGVDRFTMRDGLAVAEQVYFDTLPLWTRLDPTMARPDLIVLD